MNKWQEFFHMAVANLTTNLTRSLLSILGIVIGIASVLTILSLGKGFEKRIQERLNADGSESYDIFPQTDDATKRAGKLDLSDIDRLRQAPFVSSVLPQLNALGSARSRFARRRTTITAVDESSIKGLRISFSKGRPFSAVEYERPSFSVMLSQELASSLFLDNDPIGQSIYLDNSAWQVIGVFKYPEGTRRKERDRIEVLIPAVSAVRQIRNLSIIALEVRVLPTSGTEVEEELKRLMERDDPRRQNLFMVRNDEAVYKRTREVQKSFSIFGLIIAGISLLVGGIGMMNVMLISITERSKEIGLRRALGATRRDVLMQFLAESCVLSVLGGFFGLLGGAAMAKALPILLQESLKITPQIVPSFIGISLITGIIMGVVFGFYPAVKASALAPAEALRSE